MLHSLINKNNLLNNIPTEPQIKPQNRKTTKIISAKSKKNEAKVE